MTGIGAVIGLAVATLVLFLIGSGTNAAAAVATALFFPCAVALYAAPTLVAHTGGHHNRMAISVLNLLLGWTLLGWVAALVWAFSAAPVQEAPITPQHPGDGAADVTRRACPHCAEPILPAARLCRFCGRDVQPAEVDVGQVEPHRDSAAGPPPAGVDAEVMAALGIRHVNGRYCLGEYRYDRLADAVAYARRATSGRPPAR